MDTSTPHPKKPLRPALGLDVPCSQCGRPIYYNYKGPVAGLCGRCSDGSRKPVARFTRSRRIGFFAGRQRRRRIAATVLAIVAAGVAAFFLSGLL